MKLHYSTSILFLFFLIGNGSTQPHKRASQKTSTSEKKQVIIFDLTNVLFKENQIGFAKKIGYGELASYAITHWKSPGYRCLDMLDAISKSDEQKPHISITLKNRTMPRCIVELHEGTKKCCQARTEIAQCIEQLDKDSFFSSVKEKKLMLTIMNLILDPEVLATVTEPIKQTVQLVQKLKSAGHKLYLCANAPEELFSSIKTNYPEIIQLFDGVVISSHIKKIKPDVDLFNHLLNSHNLTAQECILIDDLETTADVAKQCGMQVIVHDKISHVTNKVRSCGVKI